MADEKKTVNREDTEGPLWEVFVQTDFGKPHEHAGSVHAPDAEMALQAGRDVYGRRESPKSMWVVRADDISATSPSDAGPFFEPSEDKIYRHPTFYKIPKGVKHI